MTLFGAMRRQRFRKPAFMRIFTRTCARGHQLSFSSVWCYASGLHRKPNSLDVLLRCISHLRLHHVEDCIFYCTRA